MRDIPADLLQAADKLWEMLPAKPLEESTGIECVRLLALAILAERQRCAEIARTATQYEEGRDIAESILSPSVKET